MDENVMRGKTSWSVKGRMTIQKRKPAERGQSAQRVLITAGVIVVVALLAGVLVGPLCAQPYPNKPIRFILPMAVGGSQDILGRIVGKKLADQLGQPVVIENRGGSGGNVGYGIAVTARPDGYTILLSGSSITISPSLYKKLNYDPTKDFVPISRVSEMPYLVIIRPSLPVKNLKEFVEYARANPGKLNYGSSGIGTSPQLAIELLKSMAKINIVHVPYKGAGQMMIGILGGEVDLLVIGPGVSVPAIQAGKVRALAVRSAKRVPSLPNVPTAKEAGIDNWEGSSWYGIMGLAGTPRDIINRLSAEWIKIAAMPDTIEMMQKAGFEPLSETPEQFAEFLKKETERWAKVIKDANIPKID